MEKRPIVITGALKGEINYLIEMLESCDIETNSIYKFYFLAKSHFLINIG